MILIDDRVGSAELAPFVSSPKLVCRLDYADFAFTGNGPDGGVEIGIERKGLMDLLQSMVSGRLVGHQLIGMKQNYDWSYLLVEGMWRPDKQTGVLMRFGSRGRWIAATQGARRFMARDIYSFLQSIQILCGVVVIQTANRAETGKWLDSAFGWWQKGWGKHKAHLQWNKPKVYASLQKPNLVTRMAAQLEGIGWDKARKIGEEFVSVDGFVNGDENDFKEIDGIGPKLAKSIVEQLGVI